MIEPFLALEASAGSGKTFALSVRYIALVLSGAAIKGITALTFTKKAASEMNERIVNTFLNLHAEAKNAERMALCEMLECGEDELIALRDKRMGEFLQSELKIMTFDAFFSSILRSFSLNLGLSPDFESKDEHGEILQSEFVRSLVKTPTLLRALALYIVLSQKSKGSFFKTIESFYENFSEVNFSPFSDENAANEAIKILNDLHEFAKNKGASATVLKTFEAKRADEILKKSFLQYESLNYRTYSKIYDAWMDEKFAALKDALKRYARHLQSFRFGELNGFLQSYRSEVLNLNKRLNELTFTDITKLTHELLKSDKELQMLYFRLDARITHLLIDEFQDTNVVQYEIMLPLIAEIVSGYGQNGLGSFFYVGDTKQSIYRFRGGKKELFDRLMDEFKQINSRNLTTNYRSAQNLVEFVNDSFKDKIDGYASQTAHSGEAGFLKITNSEDMIKAGVSEVAELLRAGVASEDITILCWKNDDVRTVCENLIKEGINARDEGASELKNSPAVFALINYVKFCLFDDEIYRQNALSFLGKKQLDKIKLDILKNSQQNLIYAAQKVGLSLQNLDILKLISLAKKSSNLIDFIFKFETLNEKSAQNTALGVRVMTVHKSKGLEFEHVILLDKTGKDRPDDRSFICEYDVKKGYEIALKVDNREFFDDEYKELKEYSNKLDRQEEINKLYVAMTRAKSSLIIIKKQEPSGNSPSYFSSYESNKKEVCYLELEPCVKGALSVRDRTETILPASAKKIELVDVARETTASSAQDEEKNLHAIYFGLALHYLLEMSAEFSDDALKLASVPMRNKFGKFLDANDLDDVENRGLNLINNAEFKQLTHNAIIKKEQALNFNGQKKQLDLLCEKDDEIIVIDYKSSKFSVEKNMAQVKEYVEILSQINRQKRVHGVIFYILKERSESIEI